MLQKNIKVIQNLQTLKVKWGPKFKGAPEWKNELME